MTSPVVTQTDLTLADGRTLHVYDAIGKGTAPDLAVFWHHGTPNLGAPPEPLLPAAAERAIRLVSYDRPGYGASTRYPGRTVSSAAADVSAIADALSLGRFAVIGHSGGGMHALACGALLAEQVQAVACISGLAPVDAQGLDWFAGMASSAAAELRAAVEGRAVLENYLASSEFHPEMFTPADLAALEGTWSWLWNIAGQALEGGTDGMVDDDLAYVTPWGFDPAQVAAPVLFLHGGEDRIAPRSHGEWLARRCRSAELRISSEDGHVSVLESAVTALNWLRQQADEQ
jgi:pimeloyl-ACP methyl ester carboxylesterase